MIEIIQKTLNENGISYEDVSQDLNITNVYYITIDGDWKHDHRFADELMQRINLNRLGEKDVEENGDDWYRSTHIYICL